MPTGSECCFVSLLFIRIGNKYPESGYLGGLAKLTVTISDSLKVTEIEVVSFNVGLDVGVN